MDKPICIISPSLKAGGIERALTLLANEFIEQGQEVVFISCLRGKEYFTLNKKITIVRPNFHRKKGALDKIRTYGKMLWFIRQTVRSYAPKSVLVYGDYFAPMALFALLGVGIPVFISDRMSPDLKFPKSIRLAKKMLYPTATGFIAQTTKSLQINRDRYGNALRYQVIPNALNKLTAMPIAKKDQIACVARMHQEKGLDRALKMLALLKNKNYELHIAGGGSELEKQVLEKLAKELGITDRVKFRGEISDIETFLSESKIFVLTSRSEGFPNALCEAMSMGLLCVSFDSLNDPEIITHHGLDGFIVKDDHIEEMAATVDDCIIQYNSLNKVGENAKAIAKRLEPKKISKRLLDFMYGNDN